MWNSNTIFLSLDNPLLLDLRQSIENKATAYPEMALCQHPKAISEELPHGFVFPMDGDMQWVDRRGWGDRTCDNFLLPHQIRFLQDTATPSLGLVGGYGSGKSRSLALKAIQLAGLNQGYAGTLYSATYELATQVLMPVLEEMLLLFNIPYKYRATPLPKFTLHLPGGDTVIFIRAFENQARIIGYNLAWAGIDEIDTIRPGLAETAWKKLQGRMRAGNIRQIFTGSTPEGYRFLYGYFEEQRLRLEAEGKNPNRALIRASTLDNPFLPDDFVDRLYNEYPEELVQAYIHGHFVNLNGNTVYYCYDRQLNRSDRIPKDTDILHIGMDFNIGKMAAVVFVDEGEKTIACGELVDLYDTPAMINAIKQRFPNQAQHRMIRIYPDASGNNRDTRGSGETDHTLLVQAGFQVLANPSNPGVRDRINSGNAMFCNSKDERRLLVNDSACPQLANALEQQTWVDGKPDKSRGIDHELDAFGYPIIYRFPITTSGWANRKAAYA